jgi:hypothetical protein
MKKAYTSLINELIPKAPGCGELSFQHELGILSAIGLMPLWVFSYATVDYNGLPMKHFQAEFPCLSVSNENKRLSTIESLNALLNSTFGVMLTLQDTENIICKAFRAGVRNPSTVMNRSSLRKKSKCHFRDLIFPNQCVIKFFRDGFTIFNSDEAKSSYSGALIKTWPCCGELLDMSEVASRYHEMNLKSASSVKKYQDGMRPTNAFLRKEQSIQFEYELPIYQYGDTQTKHAARRMSDKIIFN